MGAVEVLCLYSSEYPVIHLDLDRKGIVQFP